MAKFHGTIGFTENVKTKPGIWEDRYVEREYSGEFRNSSGSFQSTDQVQDNVVFANGISIVADGYAMRNFLSIRYVILQGIKWKISKVEPIYPRLLLTVGGVFDGAASTGT